MCEQLRFISVCAFSHYDHIISFPSEETLGPCLHIECPSKTMIRLRGRTGWSESSMAAHVYLYLLQDTVLSNLGKLFRFRGMYDCENKIQFQIGDINVPSTYNLALDSLQRLYSTD